MSKIHVLPDENLGGVLREFVEVDREANVGDKIVIVNPHECQFGYRYTKGTIMSVEKANEDGDVYCGKFDIIEQSEYQTLEPTDIVHIDGKRYRLVDREAKVGERIIIVNGYGWYRDKVGYIYDVIHPSKYDFEGNDNSKAYVEYEKNAYNDVIHFVRRGDYRVLEHIEPNEIVNSEEGGDKSVLDLLANLAQRVAELERQQKENRELIIKAFESIYGKDNVFTVEERVAMLEREVSEMYKRLRKSEEKIEMALDDIITLDERTQPLLALIKAVKDDG